MIPKIAIAPMVMPKIVMRPMDIHIDQQAIEDGVRQGMAMQKMSVDMARKMAKMEGELAQRTLVPDQKYKDAMRGAGLSANDRETRQLYMMGVSPRYVQSLRDAGLKNLTAHDVIRLHTMGITAGLVKDLKRMQQ